LSGRVALTAPVPSVPLIPPILDKRNGHARILHEPGKFLGVIAVRHAERTEVARRDGGLERAVRFERGLKSAWRG
jgi:hypothetical protein